jgi:hypothetical protein
MLYADFTLLLDKLHEAVFVLLPKFDDIAFISITKESTNQDVVFVLSCEVERNLGALQLLKNLLGCSSGILACSI